MRLALLFWAVMFSGLAAAHQQTPAIVDIELLGNGAFTLAVRTNLEARMAGIGAQHADTDDSPQAQAYAKLRAEPLAGLQVLATDYEPQFREGLRLTFDGQPASLHLQAIEVPEVADLRLPRQSTVRYRGSVPAGAKQLGWRLAPDFGDNVLRIRVAGEDAQVSHWLKNGAASPSFALADGLQAKSSSEVAVEYTVLGFEHILPKGLDHILFVLGLFLLSLKLRPLLWQVTAFTLAHTVTLAASILGYISLSPSIIEPLIALSIAYVGIENVLTRTLHAWRPVIVFLFGLLHGMGFASVLTDLGLPESDLALALITFNVGVELGQLAVILAAFLLTLPMRSQPEIYRRWVVIPSSLAIAVTGLYWTWERLV